MGEKVPILSEIICQSGGKSFSIGAFQLVISWRGTPEKEKTPRGPAKATL